MPGCHPRGSCPAKSFLGQGVSGVGPRRLGSVHYNPKGPQRKREKQPRPYFPISARRGFPKKNYFFAALGPRGRGLGPVRHHRRKYPMTRSPYSSTSAARIAPASNTPAVFRPSHPGPCGGWNNFPISNLPPISLCTPFGGTPERVFYHVSRRTSRMSRPADSTRSGNLSSKNSSRAPWRSAAPATSPSARRRWPES